MAKNEILPGELHRINIVLTEKVPEKLVVFHASVKRDFAEEIKAKYENGTALSEKTAQLYAAHLTYCHEVGDQFFEAGSSADFSEVLYIFGFECIVDARKIMENDPFSKAGIFEKEEYFGWAIHSPYYKSSAPPIPGRDIDVVVEETTPRTLVAGIGTADFSSSMAFLRGEVQRPLHELLHVFNRCDAGGAGPNGYDWAVGPSSDFTKALHIMNVPSLSLAKEINELDASYRWGIVDNFHYFEWYIHFPLRKASPRHKAILTHDIEALR